MKRWWIYQKERFPLVQHGPLIAVFSFCAVSFSAQLRGAAPGWGAAAVAFGVCLLIFLQLRLADEFKDAEEDARYRPYRPVPRGLVKLRELAWLGVGAAAVQALLAGALDPRLLGLLLLTWAYLALMSVEFFAPRWLKARPVTYLWTHMLIMPLVDLFATAADWLPAGKTPGPGLPVFLAASFFNGVALEIGRKIRSPEEEETGVETYTYLWGHGAAVGAWWGALAALGGFGVAAGAFIGNPWTVGLAYLPVLAAAAWAGLRFLRQPGGGQSRRFEAISGLATLSIYGSLGILSLLW